MNGDKVNGNTRTLMILFGATILITIIGIVAIAIYAPKDQITLMATITGFVLLIIPIVFNLFKTQESVIQAQNNAIQLERLHRDVNGKVQQLIDAKAEGEFAKGVVEGIEKAKDSN